MLREPEPVAVANSGIRRGEVTVEVLLDPPGHIRLPIGDDEIVDRALSVRPFSRWAVKLLTYDTEQSMRGRAAGLGVIKLARDPADEPV